MKTIITKEIEKHKIIIGFGEAVIEPVETEKKVKGLIEKTVEVKAFNNKIKEIEIRNKAINSSMLMIRGAQKTIDNPNASDVDKVQANEVLKNEKENLKNSYDKRIGLQSELKSLHNDRMKKRKDIFFDNRIYFETKKGEECIPDAEYLELYEKFQNRSENYLLKRDGTEIADFRNVEYFKRVNGTWTKTTVEKIGIVIESGGLEFMDLTEEQRQEISIQFENDRIKNLGKVEKATEKNNIIEGLAGQAVMMRSKLEIQGTAAATALKDSKAWYDNEVAAVNAKYA